MDISFEIKYHWEMLSIENWNSIVYLLQLLSPAANILPYLTTLLSCICLNYDVHVSDLFTFVILFLDYYA